MANNDPSQSSEYLDYLPAAFQSDAVGDEVPFLGRFLLPFQRLLSGLPGTDQGTSTPNGFVPPGLEQLINRIHTYFLPGPDLPDDQRAPVEFLPWLAGWVAASLSEDWPADTKRRFIQEAPALYARRGTKECLRKMLTFFLGTDKNLEISDALEEEYCFAVRFRVGSADDARRYEPIARAIIDREKPAHTYYRLTIESPQLEIVDLPRTGVDAQGKHHEGILVGVNTWLGVGAEPNPRG